MSFGVFGIFRAIVRFLTQSSSQLFSALASFVSKLSFNFKTKMSGAKKGEAEGILPYPRTPQQLAAQEAMAGLTETVENTKDIMQTNLDKVNERGDKLAQLEKTTDAICKGAEQLAGRAKKLGE